MMGDVCGQNCSQQLEQYKKVAEAMAQDLREYADAAQEAGEGILATESLLSEFDVVSNLVNGFGVWDKKVNCFRPNSL